MGQGEEVLVLLGGDRGDLKANFDRATALMGQQVGRVLAIGRDHWTEPWGMDDEALFLNRAVLLRTHLGPEALLEVVMGIENEMGRVRPASGGPVPRTIDMDILLMGDRVLSAPDLQLPHPRMHMRRFALAPAADVAPGMRHPLLGRTVLELLGELRTTAQGTQGNAS